ncbi:hypothetical protein RISK_003715 [Rhodopirellula islandica]|uniref:Uncharacterized protein n=1 Tax=Rhodopirellula islandica TaxID=595434 RepID=A0A0J1EF27_RHOIS|nr:hypothetical protein RISK_003715 [Rhodopirellula islandica]
MTSRWDSVSGGGVDFVIRFSWTEVLQNFSSTTPCRQGADKP